MAQNRTNRYQEQRERELRERRRQKRMQIIRRRRMMLGSILILIAVLVIVIIVSATQKSRETAKDTPASNIEQQNNGDNLPLGVPDTQTDADTDSDTDAEAANQDVHGLPGENQYTVVIDPGHGGKDTGGAHGDATDKEISLAIGLKLRTELEKRNVHVEMTRDDDTFIKLEERVSFAESVDADLFISLHTDSYEQDSSVHGLTVHYPYQQTDRSAFASLLHDNIAEADIIRVRDLKNTDLYVIMNTTMMATLVECGYLSNPEDLEKLQSEDFQQELAVVMADSVVEYFETNGGQAE